MTKEEMALYFVVYMFEGSLLWKYCEILFGKNKKIQNLYLIEAGYSVLFLLALSKNPLFNTVVFIIISCICICTLYKIKWYTAIFHAFIISVAMGIGELFAFCVTLPILPMLSDFTPILNLFINAVLSKLIYFVVLILILVVIKGNADREEKFSKIVMFVPIVPIMSIIVVLMFLFFIVYAQPEFKFGLIIIICTILVSVFNLIVIYMYHYILKKNKDFTSLQLQLQKENDLVDYYKMLIQKNEDRNILIHDIRKHLQTILILNEHKEHDKITDYIYQMIQESNLTDTVHVSDNELLNAIVNRYRKECQINRIAFYTDIRSYTIHFMKENDLTSLFCNLLDNAFEAALGQENAFIELTVIPHKFSTYTSTVVSGIL